MAFEKLKDALLSDAGAIIDQRSDSNHRADLHRLSERFLRRFPAEDLRGRSAENVYGCLYGLLRFMQRWSGDAAKVRFLNPSISAHGWESRSTVVAILCRDMPFCTASVRGELNQRGIAIHCLASCNLRVHRNSSGELQAIAERGEADGDEHDGISAESLLYFEISRHSRLEDLQGLHESVEAILGEVAAVVEDFASMRECLADARAAILDSQHVEPANRQEAAVFLDWLQGNHMTFLGYEFLSVKDKMVAVSPERSLGVLRNRQTLGVRHLQQDLQSQNGAELLRRQLSFAKSSQRSRVHRQAYPDYIEVKVYGAEGELTGQHRFLGLYTASVYNLDPELIPIVRRKVAAVLSLSGLTTAEHDGRELKRVLEVMPRDELFQTSIDVLYATASAINRIQERPQTRLFVREDVHGNFVNCLVFMPRDRYTTQQRQRIQRILTRAYNAEEAEFTTQFTESVLVRIYFVMRVSPSRRNVTDVNEIEEQIVQATLAWKDRLRLRLLEEFGEERGEQLMRDFGSGFAPGYRDDFDPRVAVLDVQKLLELTQRNVTGLGMHLYRQLEEQDDHLKLRLYHAEAPLPLSDVLPILENLGLRVVSERAYPVRAGDERRFWIQEFSLIYSLASNIELETVKEEFEGAFTRIWFGEAESDSFNRLLLGSRLGWREIALLRAYACYLGQINFPYSRAYIAETMADHLPLSGAIVELFLTRFSPVFDGDDEWRAEREIAVEKRILAALDSVENLGQDRIIRQYVMLIKATLRSNFFQQGADGNNKAYFSFKLLPSAILDIPKPVPLYEIFVYSPRVEGVHLRGGKVARGGLRWSDRLEDFRTEVLGLVKAQQVKNAVIVPVGAKGGFVAKRLHPAMTRDEMQEEGIACYQMFIRGLLDITDNRRGDSIVRPHMTVCKDDEDPYLVVAADKGTASFSDIANELADEYDFWLGDAFASGGSVGYDHKKMGITARGAWVSVERHFREIGINVAATDFSVVGIGDMSGDVFGNGMLLSPHIRLLAAFNHQHIFIDPNPDAACSFSERRRLFELPRSGWNDYNSELISEGGGVFSRSAKAIHITAAMRERFAIHEQSLTPTQLISALLRADVDLLWNGGIGTYVKSSQETHRDVGDKTNDALRVDARNLRCRVIAEGGNLGVTQLGRVEFALAGGRSNTDFIDNAGGVDCSDHEVNIKILLDAIVARGDLTVKQRNELLQSMTGAVAALVLANNYRQVQAISLTEREARDRSGEYRRLIGSLANSGRLDRELEFLPSDEEITERLIQGRALTRPELAVLVSYSKAILKEKLLGSDLGQDPHLAHAVTTAFPQQLVERFPDDVAAHRLHREILCTQVANDMVNRMGLNFVRRQQKATGASEADVARAYTSVLAIFRVAELWEAVEALDYHVPADIQTDMMLVIVRLVKRATRWLLRNRRHQLAPTAVIEEFRAGMLVLTESLPGMLHAGAADLYDERRQRYLNAGVEQALAEAIAICLHAFTGLAIADVAAASKSELLDVAELYFDLGESLELDWFGGLILSSKIDNEWQAMAREAYLEDLQWQQCTLALGILAGRGAGDVEGEVESEGEGEREGEREGGPERRRKDQGKIQKVDIPKAIEAWEARQAPLLGRWREMLSELHAVPAPDFAMFAVANRELLDLAQASRR